ncbi:SagB family peptide dehydrogenase [Streptomyces sp. NPDC029216]|uniref:SagB family peptide dehydrogenase n=1 Tax=Streptomyces sp. NPDC029216 TaxID=3154701 RepID=UPI0033DB59CB
MTVYDPSPGTAALAYLGSGHRPPDALPAADPAGLPPVHKRYPSAGRLFLPGGRAPGDTPRDRLSRLLRLTNGITRMRWMSGLMPLGLGGAGAAGDRRVLLSPGRTAAASGSRYPVEVYVAQAGAEGLPSGLFHYDPVHHVLERLRDGDGRARVLAALRTPPAREPEALLLLSSVLWRNAAKYGTFGYRLQSLDVGAVVAQAVAAAGVAGLAAEVHLHFDDAALDGLLGLDSYAEGVFAVVALHRQDGPPLTAVAAPASEAPVSWTGPVPAAEPGLPAVSGIPSMAEAAALHAAVRACGPGHGGPPLAGWVPPSGAPRHALPQAALSVADGFAGRRTVYGYRPRSVPEDSLAALLAAAAAPLPGGAGGDGDVPPVVLAGVVQRVPGVETGAHVYDPAGHALVRTRGADAVPAVIGAAKSPMLADECRSATATLAACGPLRAGIERFGDRWYRTQNIAAGALAQRIALAAAAAGLESHVHCDFDPDLVGAALGLGPGGPEPLVVVTVGPGAPERTDPQQAV